MYTRSIDSTSVEFPRDDNCGWNGYVEYTLCARGKVFGNERIDRVNLTIDRRGSVRSKGEELDGVRVRWFGIWEWITRYGGLWSFRVFEFRGRFSIDGRGRGIRFRNYRSIIEINFASGLWEFFELVFYSAGKVRSTRNLIKFFWS